MSTFEAPLGASEDPGFRDKVRPRQLHLNGAALDVGRNTAAKQIRLLDERVGALAREWAADRTQRPDADAVTAADRALLAEFALVECSRVLRSALDVVDGAERSGQGIEPELDIATGRPNRLSFRGRPGRASAGGAPAGVLVGLLFIDLDAFKAINDRHGHEVGDELSKVVAARLGRSIRAEDSVSRHGGDGFVCLLLDVADEAQVTKVARKLFSAVSAPCKVGELMLSVSPSIGVAVLPRDGTPVEELLETADRAMYAARRRTGY